MCDWRNAAHCRDRAETLRTIAAEIPHVFHKQALTRVAEYYEAMAEALERDAKDAGAP